ncbi:MAG TPA: copper resistance protein CopC [Xanthobacteraceae bacterium]|nr:copper resistance protein CopC [Xanthobacteraceae bacterium]
MRKLFPLAIALLAALVSTPALAHAFLDHSDPRVGSTVAAPPHELTLSFTQKLEPAFSGVEVTGPNGSSVGGKAQVSGNTMRVGIKGAGPGAYHVHWHALSVDTHKTQGSFTFTVGGH